MKKYNFDEVIERKNTDSVKFGKLKARFGKEDLLPMWVADMDFQSPPEVVEALAERVKHGVFGYPFASDEYYHSIINWQGKHHDWNIKREEISYIPGIVKGIAFVINEFTKKGDIIIIQPPVYHPFRILTETHERVVVNNPLLYDGVQYKMDFKGLREILAENECKLFILSNPHNPGGRVWTKEELAELAEICFEHKVLVISDEIHSDLVFKGYKHIPFALVSERAAQNSIIFNAPSKTFNIAGIVTSYSIIKNKEIRDRYYRYLEINELGDGNIFAYLSLQISYEKGEQWLIELKDYIKQNIDFIDQYLKQNIPQIKAVMPEASFLVWLDCKELKMSQDKLVSLFINDAKLALNNGVMFGEEGEGFMRLNVGCPRSIVEKSLKQLESAVKQLV